MNEPQQTATSLTERRDQGPEGSAYREPPLLRYLRLLWERRWLVLGGSLLPAFLVACVLYLWPRRYTATFVYERPLAESEYSVFQRRFYSQENLDKMIGRLQEQGLTRYVQQLEQARTQQSFEKLIRFEVAPMYPKRLQTTDPCTSEKISAFKARLLSIKVFGDSAQEVAGASAIVTGNIESVLPLYDIRNHLKESLQKLRVDAAKIEDDRFKLSIDLQKEQAKLEKLKALQGEGQTVRTEEGQRAFSPSSSGTSGLVLQFNNIEKSRDYLPLSYQIPALQSKIVDLQETLTSNTEKYNFYLQELDLNNRLLGKIEASLLTYYTAQEYLAFLGEQLLACKEQALCDHLKSYLRNTENLILVNTRAGENPVVYPMPKGAVKGGALAFVLSLMLAMFAAVVLEHRHEQRRQLVLDRGLRIAAPDQSPA